MAGGIVVLQHPSADGNSTSSLCWCYLELACPCWWCLQLAGAGLQVQYPSLPLGVIVLAVGLELSLLPQLPRPTGGNRELLG